ncbi:MULTISPECIES: branched-chain amino acid aminotransferase [Fructobacillus]|jgi:branched-chain amino acid aminotransferase|uniref:Branched-chain-amino-acid aminotransferase n=2 Tax=Fructobacillus TaxID=559173 RepID=A0ABM9MRL8_9LACO|nr:MULTISPECIES: branched-chain amino acid aminotransferase [Fructobacillus]CAK1228297.1 Branched-chain amino acid aminotransferase/4-amino-4-deoxychorismate lyase (IlvE) [Fructobacillus cardui]CAK1241044.1 Branched-chain amino acid aminotransferase/4-amino-4-deoxychorismate lyase (IlvE) [Fructobacillus sp. LMG 32999]KMK54218.1 putative branched-chain-amino-acid aminotransferase [Fructobacillus sp. EFB-N1]NLS37625.1 branched-chain amino acid aminotransferase [Fructobacillus tropaeoli]CAK122516
MTKAKVSDLDFNNLGFGYHDLPYRYKAEYHDGQWQPGELTTDSTIHLSESAVALHYGQEVFEGLKAYRRKDGGVNIFRPDRNAHRMHNSAERLLMAPYPEDKFVEAVKEVVKANQDFIPPYESGGSLYLRPLLISTSPEIGVHPGHDFLFTIFAMPVGAYYPGGLAPTAFVTSEFDRAAHGGTGQAKVGGNYAASMLPGDNAHKAGYSDVVYLDPREHEYIEELGSANFFGITKDGQFKTPKSPSILPSVTKYSLLALAEEMGMNPVEEAISIHDLDQFAEAGAMGTAAVISPVGSITHEGKKHVFFSETEVGPKTQALYDRLIGIQYGDQEGPEGWVQDVPLV